MKAREFAPRNAINSLTGLRAMKREIWRLFHPAMRLCAVVCVAAVSFVVVGCGDGGGGGSEDTGTTIEASVSWPDPQTRNIDISPDDTDNDGVIDVFLTDNNVTVDFVSTDVTPGVDTATDVRVEWYSIDYVPSPNNPSAPVLASQEIHHTFVIPAHETVNRGDILVVHLATKGEFLANLTTTPEQDPPEYTAHYKFHMRNIPFDKAMWVTMDVPISFAYFVQTNTP